MSDLTVKQGDLLPQVNANLTITLADGTTSPAPLTGVSVRFRMRLASGGPMRVDAAASVIDLPTATVRYAWVAGNTDVAGDYLGEFVVTYPGPIPETFPDSGYVTIGITPKLADTTTYAGLVGISDYRIATLDTTSADVAVTGALVRAQNIVSDWLRRPLESKERTEILIIDSLARVYPSAIPITSLPNGLTSRGSAVLGIIPNVLFSFVIDYSRLDTPRMELTYTGGWTSATLPETVREHICWKAYELLRSPAAFAGVPTGATMLKTGDTQVMFASGVSTSRAAVLSDEAKKALKPWRRVW